MIDNFDVSVELIRVTPEAEKLIEFAGRVCYDSLDKLGENEHWIQNRIKQGHESIIEHASATFLITSSRSFSHQLVRHRLASYSQRSQRYVKETEPNYIVPPDIHESKALIIFENVMETCWNAYKEFLKMGINPEHARYVLPNACRTEIVCTWNFRIIRHIIRLRTDKASMPEMRAIAGKIKDIMQKEYPMIFGDL